MCHYTHLLRCARLLRVPDGFDIALDNAVGKG